MAIDVTVRNFQSIRSAGLVLDGLTVIVGPSDRGKSALLRTIETALFNRSGTQFVRYGSKFAEVGLTLPVEGGVRRVRWTKGKDVNKFTVDDQDYAKAGKVAPEVLQQIGFREIVIGAKLKDDGKLEGGQTIRPQIARQFNRIYLLEETGGFLNEVLIGLSRLSVLQRAGRLCAADLRTVKSLLKTRQGDLEAALATRDALAPVVELRQRVEALLPVEKLARAAALQIATLRQRIDVRTAAQAILQHPLPRRHLPLPDDNIARVAALQGLVHARKTYQQQLTAKIPRKAPRETKGDQVLALRPLVAERKRLLAQLATVLPPPRVLAPETIALTNRVMALRPLVIEQRQQRNWMQEGADRSARATKDRAALDTELATLLKANPVCPIC